MKQENECSFERKLNAYIAGELNEKEYKKVQMHISSCHLCQNEIRELQKLDGLLSKYAEEEVPAGLNEKILNSVPTTRANP